VTDNPPDHGSPNDLQVWNRLIDAYDGVWTHYSIFEAEADYFGSLTNVVTVTSVQGVSGTDSVTVFVGFQALLPLVMR